MGRITIRQQVDAVKNLLATDLRFKQAQANELITESIPEVPIAQVYFQSRALVSTSTDRNTFGSKTVKPIRVKQTTINVDVYARQRSQIGQDIAAVQDLTDAVDELLEGVDGKPYFGIPQLEAFTYSMERVTFEVAQTKYAGVRFTLDLMTM